MSTTTDVNVTAKPVVEGDETPAAHNFWKLVLLASVVGGLITWGILAGAAGWVAVLLALITMVMLHEFGHFIAAKKCGMQVDSYFLGFGPRLWSVTFKGTEYGIRAIPAGGFVKIPGMSWKQEVDPAIEARTYRQQTTGKKVLVVSAGSLMHLLMAFLLIYGVLVFYGVRAPNQTGIDWVTPNSAAAQAGISPSDVILSANGKTGSLSNVNQVIMENVGKPIHLVLSDHGQIKHVTITAKSNAPPNGVGIYTDYAVTSDNPLFAIGDGITDLGRTFYLTVDGLGKAFSPSGLYNLGNAAVNGGKFASSTSRPESIVGIARTTADYFYRNPLYLVEVMVAANISIGLLNMLPILPLDGGYAGLAIYERVRSRRGIRYKANENKQAVAIAFFGAIMVFMVGAALYLDISHPVHP